MNILQILPALDAGGVERTAVDITEALCANGHSAHVLSQGGRLAGAIEALGGVNHFAPIGSKNLFSVPWRIALIRRIIADYKIDVVHARSRAPAWPAFYAAKAENIAFVTTYHGIYNARSALKRGYNAIMTRGRPVIANSNFTKAHIMDTHGIDAQHIIVIPRGVDMEYFDPQKLSAADIAAKRQSWEIQPGHIAILLPGRLTGWKGQRIAIAALAMLPDNYRLICAGDAQGREDYVDDLKRQIAQLGLEQRVILAGHERDMGLAYAACDWVICPSTDPEAFGRTAAEAQAMGKPVIASAHGGALETVDDGKTGYLIAPSDAQALAQALRRGADGLTDMGSRGRARIAQNFSKTQLQQKTLKIYQQLLSPIV